MNVYQRLNEAREQFHALKLEKTGWNPYSEFKYFELADFVIPAMGIFKKNGICAVCSFDPVASMTITNVDKPEEKIIITAPFSSAKLKASHEIQNVGACETYHRRYFWIVALEIVEHDALDKTLGKGDMRINPAKESAKAAATVIDLERQSELEDMALASINYWKADNKPRALELAHEIEDDMEKLYFWNLLQTESSLRAYIKANPRK
jgi:hypothetical protein